MLLKKYIGPSELTFGSLKDLVLPLKCVFCEELKIFKGKIKNHYLISYFKGLENQNKLRVQTFFATTQSNMAAKNVFLKVDGKIPNNFFSFYTNVMNGIN